MHTHIFLHTNMNAEDKVVELLNKLTNDINKCADSKEYYELLLSVFVFHDLVKKYIHDSLADASESNSIIKEFENLAESMSERISITGEEIEQKPEAETDPKLLN